MAPCPPRREETNGARTIPLSTTRSLGTKCSPHEKHKRANRAAALDDPSTEQVGFRPDTLATLRGGLSKKVLGGARISEKQKGREGGNHQESGPSTHLPKGTPLQVD